MGNNSDSTEARKEFSRAMKLADSKDLMKFPLPLLALFPSVRSNRTFLE
jgi:hypothetical protein